MAPSAQIIDLAESRDDTSLVTFLKAVADDLRLHILRVLSQDSFSVSELCTIFAMRQSALSHHLKILSDAGLLSRKKEGTATFYRRALPGGSLVTLQSQVLEHIDNEPVTPAVEVGIGRVQAQREENSIAFFKGHIDRFRQQQELIAPWDDYSEVTLQLLDRLPGQPLHTLVEVGVGEGWLLPALRERANAVVALDLSERMLELAREHTAELSDIEFVRGSTEKLLARQLRADAVIINMVLHHTPDPQRMMNEAAALLNQGGKLIVSELCAHDQFWAREHCGDLWLGFQHEELERWANHAGLELTASVFLAQRNGFQVQVQQFSRT